MPVIYHITSQDAWEEAQREGEYQAESIMSEGFIHCSERSQVAGSANRYFKGQKNLIVLQIDPGYLKSRLLYEESTGGQKFPHIYGPLNLDAVRGIQPLISNQDGSFSF